MMNVVTGFTPSIPFRSRSQRSCSVTESRDFRKYPKKTQYLWKQVAGVCPFVRVQLYLPHTVKIYSCPHRHTQVTSEAHPAACALQCWRTRLSVSLLWSDTGVFVFIPHAGIDSFFFLFSLPEKLFSAKLEGDMKSTNFALRIETF